MPSRIEVPFKLCKNCKLPMMRKRDRSGRLEAPKDYQERLFCGLKCRDEKRRVRVTRPGCKHCGERIERKVWPCGATESATNLRRRKFCDAECAALWYEEHGSRKHAAMMWGKVKKLRRAA